MSLSALSSVSGCLSVSDHFTLPTSVSLVVCVSLHICLYPSVSVSLSLSLVTHQLFESSPSSFCPPPSLKWHSVSGFLPPPPVSSVAALLLVPLPLLMVIRPRITRSSNYKSKGLRRPLAPRIVTGLPPLYKHVFKQRYIFTNMISATITKTIMIH